MTMEFWLAASVLIAVAFAFVLPPLWRKHGSIELETDRYNVDIAKQRLLDLKEQRTTGTITAEEYEDLYQELQSVLADDLEFSSSPDKSETSGRWLIVLALIAIPAISISLYRTLGNFDALLPESERAEQQINEINAMVSGLAQRLQRQPDDVQGWMMLGRSYKYMNRHAEAETIALISLICCSALSDSGNKASKLPKVRYKEIEIAGIAIKAKTINHRPEVSDLSGEDENSKSSARTDCSSWYKSSYSSAVIVPVVRCSFKSSRRCLAISTL